MRFWAQPARTSNQSLWTFKSLGCGPHVNVFGICARLWHRDGKPGYPLHLPRTLDYRREACALYSELAEHAAFLERRAVPALVPTNSKVAAAAVST
jgi:aminoglycoside/choline kinase family phosphotransferase